MCAHAHTHALTRMHAHTQNFSLQTTKNKGGKISFLFITFLQEVFILLSPCHHLKLLVLVYKENDFFPLPTFLSTTVLNILLRQNSHFRNEVISSSSILHLSDSSATIILLSFKLLYGMHLFVNLKDH